MEAPPTTTPTTTTATAQEVDPLLTLYNGHRECSICLIVKQECEFAYATSCAHVFCKECIDKSESDICMTCRTPIDHLLHLDIDGSMCRLKMWEDKTKNDETFIFVIVD